MARAVVHTDSQLSVKNYGAGQYANGALSSLPVCRTVATITTTWTMDKAAASRPMQRPKSIAAEMHSANRKHRRPMIVVIVGP